MMRPDGGGACANCGAEHATPFCSACGQDNRHGRLELRALLVDACQNLIGWESALGRTLRGVTLEPGETAAEYVAGRRKRYVNPARFALFSLATWFVVTKLFGLDPMDVSGIHFSNSSGRAGEVIDGIRSFLSRRLELLLYLALPLRALFLRAFFRNTGRNLAECLVLVLFVAGFGYVLAALLTPILALEIDWIAKVRLLLTLAWSIRGAKTFFRTTWFGAIWRVSCVAALHALGTVVLFGLIAVPWVLWTTR